MTRHDIGNRTSLPIRHRTENTFSVSMRMEVDFHGYYGGDANPAMPVHAKADLPFTGLIVVPENLFPKPRSSGEVKKVAGRFVDLTAFSDPERRNYSFVFRPLI
jgi:hypothetical protein